MNFNINRQNGPKGKSNFILGTVILVLGLIFLFYIATGIFKLLSFIAPFLLVLALIINYKVVLNYLKSIWTNLSKNPLYGILMIIFTILGFPIVSAYLLFKAIIYKKVDRLDRKSLAEEEQFSEYEDVSDETDFMDLKELEELKKPGKEKNDYENLF